MTVRKRWYLVFILDNTCTLPTAQRGDNCNYPSLNILSSEDCQPVVTFLQDVWDVQACIISYFGLGQTTMRNGVIIISQFMCVLSTQEKYWTCTTHIRFACGQYHSAYGTFWNSICLKQQDQEKRIQAMNSKHLWFYNEQFTPGALCARW